MAMRPFNKTSNATMIYSPLDSQLLCFYYLRPHQKEVRCHKLQPVFRRKLYGVPRPPVFQRCTVLCRTRRNHKVRRFLEQQERYIRAQCVSDA